MTTSEVKALLRKYGVELRQRACGICTHRAQAGRCAKCEQERKTAALRAATDTLSLLDSRKNADKEERHA